MGKGKVKILKENSLISHAQLPTSYADGIPAPAPQKTCHSKPTRQPAAKAPTQFDKKQRFPFSCVRRLALGKARDQERIEQAWTRAVA
jgi:hypothetical protein